MAEIEVGSRVRVGQVDESEFFTPEVTFQGKEGDVVGPDPAGYYDWEVKIDGQESSYFFATSELELIA